MQAASADRIDELCIQSAARKEAKVEDSYEALQRKLGVWVACLDLVHPCCELCREDMQSWGKEQMDSMLCSVQDHVENEYMEYLASSV